MKTVDLRSGYVITGFADFEAAFAASEDLCSKGYKVIYLNEASHVLEHEVISYVREINRADEVTYQNYHAASHENAFTTALDSFKSALEVLQNQSGHQIRFIVIFSAAKTKSFKVREKLITL
ncbi:hypothetical protein [Pontibacter sp. SGAir0037]|uniref:hypothetical protein n=1 Tax=Pontibacter sp. SGAir0037 TaxID=2571030 RepID=UPI0010CD08E3|nr:hypothetical protein [Pontibacter sp. SGAir0037]QCR22104.1 hypothetical protein C1N53_06950 [Pontibacter sp. SGAir0037]